MVERDTELSLRGGYQLHLGVSAVCALRQLVSAGCFETLLGSSVGTRGFSLVVRDHRGRHLVRASEPSAGLSLDVDRITLRELLATGLEDRLLLGRSCQGWRVEGETVLATIHDGAVVETDILVIADGAGSKLAEKLAGQPTSTPCHLVGVAGRTVWESLPTSTRALLGTGPLLAIGPGGTGVFASAHDPVGRAAVRASHVMAGASTPVAIWGLITVEEALPPDPDQRSHAALVELSVRLLCHHHWADPVIELLTRSLQPLGWIRSTATPVGSFVLRGTTPVWAGGSAVLRAASRRLKG